MKTSIEIIQESGMGAGFDPAVDQYKRDLAMAADIMIGQQNEQSNADMALATTMALCSVVGSEVQLRMAIGAVHPYTMLKEKRDVFAGERISVNAKFSAAYGSGETRETFLAWKASGCPTGRDYVAWLSAGGTVAGRPYVPHHVNVPVMSQMPQAWSAKPQAPKTTLSPERIKIALQMGRSIEEIERYESSKGLG